MKGSRSYEMQDTEYHRMAAVEAEMWWYRSLHEDLLRQIQEKHGHNRALRILDAGCGTGGFLRYLRERGYPNLLGVDISPIAVGFCRNQGFEVMQGSIADPGLYPRLGSFDVVVSMDVICSLPSEEERAVFFRAAHQALKDGGILLVQTPAFKVLGGIHDIAVSVHHRYSKPEMKRLLERAGIPSPRLGYRLVLLTPLILAARLVQRLKLRLQGEAVKIESDVEMPAGFVNAFLLRLQRFEDRRLPWKPFGTSLQIRVEKG